MDTRLFCITHKAFTPPDLEGYVPIQVGRALSDDLGYLTDDTGDNISHKNKSYCELTGIYWIWKNISCDIVGICHYRRYFVHDEDFLSKEYVENILSDYDIIVSNSGRTENANVREHYGTQHIIGDLDICREVLAKMYPDYLCAFDLSMRCNLMSLGNMMITRKDIFNKYCEWLFPLLEEVERRTDISKYDVLQARLYGYLAERLMRVWIMCQNYKVREEEVRLVDPENRNNAEKLISLRSRYIELILDDLIKQYENSNFVDICNNEPLEVDFGGKIPAFACWWQGLEAVPEMVMNCLNSIDRHLPADKVELHLITLENVFNYITLPSWVIDKFNSGAITLTQLSDILRMGLLYRYGGLWIDATYFVTGDIDAELFEKEFWTLRFENTIWKTDVSQGRWSGNCMYTRPGNVLHRFALNAFYEYWRKQDELIDYFLIDHIISIAYRRIPGVKAMIDSVKPSNPNCHELRSILNMVCKDARWNELKRDTIFYKLQRREEVRATNIVGEQTYYGKLLDL